MPRQLPANPSLKHLKNQAKDLLKAIRAGDEDATRRLEEQIPPHKHAFRQKNLPVRSTLADAQLVIAREYGFPSWPKLKAYVDAYGLASIASKQKIKTAHWIETRTHYKPFPGSITREYWLRIDPPAQAWKDTYPTEWSYDVQTPRGRFHFASSWDANTHYVDPPLFTREKALLEVLAPLDQPSGEPWQVETVQRDGRSLLCYHRKIFRHRISVHQGKEHIVGTFPIEETIWADPDTRRIVGKETNYFDASTGEVEHSSISEQFTYNVRLPKGVFRLPEEKPMLTSRSQRWKDLSLELQQAIQTIINRSDAGWQKGDFSEFGSVWRFDYAPHLPTKADWQARFAQQAGRWQRWQSECEYAFRQNRIAVSLGRNTFNWGEEHSVWHVIVNLHLVWSEHGDGFQGSEHFFLKRIGRGFRIVHWEFPWEKIKAAHEANRSKADTL
ncbi:MAG TPA: hypothetical protein VFA07_17450 [Chthonomonadaceae bacterium]|nr:hypothetical protein [Chthonomonadaceae bacterium]